MMNSLLKILVLLLQTLKLIMRDCRTTRPLGVIRNLGVTIMGKIIPTYFFVFDACEDNHDDIIIGRPFLKLVHAILDVGKGIITLELDGIEHDFNFLPCACGASPLVLITNR